MRADTLLVLHNPLRHNFYEPFVSFSLIHLCRFAVGQLGSSLICQSSLIYWTRAGPMTWAWTTRPVRSMPTPFALRTTPPYSSANVRLVDHSLCFRTHQLLAATSTACFRRRAQFKLRQSADAHDCSQRACS